MTTPHEQSTQKSTPKPPLQAATPPERAGEAHHVSLRTGRVEPKMWPRSLNVLVGSWLFMSAFLWHHEPEVRINTWLVGVAIVLVALIAAAHERWRGLNTALSVWLLISTLVVFQDQSSTTFWNNIIVGLIVLAVSLYPDRVRVR